MFDNNFSLPSPVSDEEGEDNFRVVVNNFEGFNSSGLLSHRLFFFCQYWCCFSAIIRGGSLVHYITGTHIYRDRHHRTPCSLACMR